MMKIVLKLDNMKDEVEDKRKVMKTVASLPGIDEIKTDAKAKQLTVIGTVDPVAVVSNLRKKRWTAEIVTVGPAKEPEKKGEPKKEDKKEDNKKQNEPKKEDEPKSQYIPYGYNYMNHNYMNHNYMNHS